jgi:dTDP-4-dehydrorhamnose 3,5-epimerase-like enzyme
MSTTPQGVQIQKLQLHADGRGAVFEPLEPELLAGWRNVHTVVSMPGAVRGNHRHLRGTEFTAVLGAALVRYRAGTRIEERQVPAGEAWRFAFPAGTAHAFKNTGSAPSVLVSFNTERHDPAQADVERDELIAP